MKKQKNVAEQLLPKSYRPLSPWNYFWRAVLYSIPVIGWIFMICNAISGKSRHGRSFAGAYIFLTLLAVAVGVGVGAYLKSKGFDVLAFIAQRF